MAETNRRPPDGIRPATRQGDQPERGEKNDVEAETVDYCARDPINIILHTQGVPALATSSEGAVVKMLLAAGELETRGERAQAAAPEKAGGSVK
uniref:Uncharacterized protein n=1 Tax=Oryza punctata TaxID=4537 RepID=A0A0E0KQ92_ORYPU